jgi:hypothetical protein
LETLTVQGLVFDHVYFADDGFLKSELKGIEEKHTTSEELYYESVNSPTLSMMHYWWDVFSNFTHNAYASTCGRHDAFWRTLCCDRTDNRELLPVDFQARFESWAKDNSSLSDYDKKKSSRGHSLRDHSLFA